MTLAVVTRRLVARTQQDVQAAIRAADAAEAALATSTRPFLVEVPLGRFFKRIPMTTFLSTTGKGTAVRYVEQDEADIDIDVYNETDFRLELPLRNAGQGIALLGQPHLEIDAGSLSWRGVTRSAARLGESGAIVTVSIPYTDASGGQADDDSGRS
jgi:hypothetical protein